MNIPEPMRASFAANQSVDVFPENEDAWNVFSAMRTQWLFDPNGRRAGLNYAALVPVMALCGVTQKRRTDTFDCIRVMEVESLEVLNSGR